MIGKLKEAANSARLRAGQIARDWRADRAEKKAAKAERGPNQGAPLIWVWFLAIIAASTLIGSTWMLVVFIAGSVGTVDWAIDWRAGNDGQPGRWIWYAEATVHLIIGLGLACFCLGIAAFNAVWLHVRHYLQGLFLHVVTALGVATAFFMVAGAIVTQQWGTDARTRDQIENVGTAQAGVAAINAEIAAINEEMQRLCAPNLTTYQAQACRSGEIAWTERMATAARQNDYQLAGIERALADARQGDRWRRRLLELRREASSASVVTVEAETATVVSTGWMATFARTLEDIRKPFIAVLGELLAMTMFGVALAAWRSRQPYKVTSRESGWAPEEMQIADMRADDAIKPQPMRPTREVVTDHETGEELVKIKPREYWRKQKGRKQRVEITPEVPPDETGVEYDGGGRVGSVAMERAVPNSIADNADDVDNARDQKASLSERLEDQPHGATENGQREKSFEHVGPELENGAIGSDDSVVQTEPSDPLSLDDLPEAERVALEEAVAAELAATEPVADVPTVFDVAQEGDDEARNENPGEDAERDFPEQVDHIEPRTEPEQDERRLIAAQ